MTLRGLAVALAALGTAAMASGEEPRTLAGAGPSLALEVVGPAGPSETFAVHPGLPAALLATRVEETVRVTDWPVAPGDRRTVEVTRHEVYVPGARIVAVGQGGRREVPRSPLVFFWGAATGDPSQRVLLSVDPRAAAVGGLGVTPAGVFEIRAGRRRGEYRVAPPLEPSPAAPHCRRPARPATPPPPSWTSSRATGPRTTRRSPARSR